MSGYCACQARIWSIHGLRSGWAVAPPAASTALASSSITSRQSPTMGTSGRRTFPSSAGSMSTWMILAPGANAPTFPVTLSSKRLPSATRRSAFCMEVTAV